MFIFHTDCFKFSRKPYPKDRNKEVSEKLERMKTFKVTEGTPEDLSKAIQTFIQQAVIIGEYELDSMPPEYLQNLLDVMAKYPEYNKVTLDLIKILKSNDII